MKCLSIRQPWAWAIIHGPKRIENRSWPTRYRGPLLIHAGQSRTSLGDEENSLPDLPAYSHLVYGAIIGCVVLSECLSVEKCGELGPFVEGPFCWLVGEPVPFIEPITYRGVLGLFEVADSLVADQLARNHV